MVRPRAAAARVPPDMGIAAIIVDLVARLESQEHETMALRQQLAQQNESQRWEGNITPLPQLVLRAHILAESTIPQAPTVPTI
ncbi:hypothetical protein TIFTF001_034404 [Ficus carica]|uniref:Uncharacterized protein n=1 Tax=Ficus carica TaxID=3494 RepID=A0AA88E7V8_FICCA|nr:hypothetical protein TIFTF001_034404 [Ficus carica]